MWYKISESKYYKGKLSTFTVDLFVQFIILS